MVITTLMPIDQLININKYMRLNHFLESKKVLNLMHITFITVAKIV